MSDESPRRIIKGVRLNDVPLFYGGKKSGRPPAGTGNQPADPMVARAVEQQAGRIMEDARRRAAEIEKDAYEKGFRRGVDEAIQRAEAETDKLCRESADEARRLIQSIQQERRRIFQEIEPQAVDLVFKITEKINGRPLETNEKDIITALIREALKQSVNKEGITIKTDPAARKCEGPISGSGAAVRMHIESNRIIPPPPVKHTAEKKAEASAGPDMEADMGNIEDALNELIDRDN